MCVTLSVLATSCYGTALASVLASEGICQLWERQIRRIQKQFDSTDLNPEAAKTKNESIDRVFRLGLKFSSIGVVAISIFAGLTLDWSLTRKTGPGLLFVLVSTFFFGTLPATLPPLARLCSLNEEGCKIRSYAM